MRQWFTYDGQTSKDFGVYISGMGTYNAPRRDQTKISIPGRNGDLTLDNNRFDNIEVVYPAFIYNNFDANVAAFRNFLLKAPKYRRLEDTYHADEYRLARYTGGFTADVLDTHQGGQFELTFDCYPQRFLKVGEKVLEVSSGDKLLNRWEQTALPLVRVYGNGTLTINDVSIVIANNASYIDIDCDLQEAYKDTLATSRNENITLTDGVFFSLPDGESEITISGLSKVEIAPRWWIL